jgi:hypothetical protein
MEQRILHLILRGEFRVLVETNPAQPERGIILFCEKGYIAARERSLRQVGHAPLPSLLSTLNSQLAGHFSFAAAISSETGRWFGHLGSHWPQAVHSEGS